MAYEKRKKLYIEAMLLNVAVAYGDEPSRNPKKGDRWYYPTTGKYYIYFPIAKHIRLITGLSSWRCVTSKGFFDLSDIKESK